MPTLLIVHHTPSPATAAMYEAVLAGASHEAITDVEVRSRAALTASAVDVLEADGYILGTPANIGYMSGALKHFFDQIYYPCLAETQRRPYACYIHGNEDATGARRAIESVAGALGWRPAGEPIVVMGKPSQDELGALEELGATVAAGLSEALG